MKCPNCKAENPNDAYFCHACGYKLRKKPNGWKKATLVFLILIIVLGCIIFHYNSENYYLESNCRYYQDRVNSLNNEINQKKSTINELETQVNSLNRQIEDLQSKLPKTYYTKYDNQYVYNQCAGQYEMSSCYYPDKGSSIIIYRISDGYGLEYFGGWIPMDCLEKR